MLKRVFSQLLKGINTESLSEEDFIRVWNYWQNKLIEYEEMMTFDEVKKVEKALSKLWDALNTKYPGHGAKNYYV